MAAVEQPVGPFALAGRDGCFPSQRGSGHVLVRFGLERYLDGTVRGPVDVFGLIVRVGDFWPVVRVGVFGAVCVMRMRGGVWLGVGVWVGVWGWGWLEGWVRQVWVGMPGSRRRKRRHFEMWVSRLRRLEWRHCEVRVTPGTCCGFHE
jgi:hypothetical protein